MHPFSFLKPDIDFLDRAWAAVADDEQAQFSPAGWDKFWARASMLEAAEASVRRGPNGSRELCIRGPKSSCSETSPYTCRGCERQRQRQQEAA